MTHRYRIETSLELIIDKFDGRMDWVDVLGGVRRSTGDPEFQPGMNVVVDLTSASLKLDQFKIRRMTSAIFADPRMRFGRIAVVAQGRNQFGLAEIFGAFADHQRIFSEYRVFSEFSRAKTWLGLPEVVELRL